MTVYVVIAKYTRELMGVYVTRALAESAIAGDKLDRWVIEEWDVIDLREAAR